MANYALEPKILHSVLCPTQEELYKSYFYKEFWTIEEFVALMLGLTPERYLESTHDLSEEDLKKCIRANELKIQFLERFLKKNRQNLHLINGTITMSCWHYIRWSAEQKIPMRLKFFRNLPLSLMEIYRAFDPIEINSTYKSKFDREYHQALYLKYAQELIENSPTRLTREEIFKHPKMQQIATSFKDRNGKHCHYRKRTIIESWLPKIDPQKRRGRPRK